MVNPPRFRILFVLVLGVLSIVHCTSSQDDNKNNERFLEHSTKHNDVVLENNNVEEIMGPFYTVRKHPNNNLYAIVSDTLDDLQNDNHTLVPCHLKEFIADTTTIECNGNHQRIQIQASVDLNDDITYIDIFGNEQSVESDSNKTPQTTTTTTETETAQQESVVTELDDESDQNTFLTVLIGSLVTLFVVSLIVFFMYCTCCCCPIGRSGTDNNKNNNMDKKNGGNGSGGGGSDTATVYSDYDSEQRYRDSSAHFQDIDLSVADAFDEHSINDEGNENKISEVKNAKYAMSRFY